MSFSRNRDVSVRHSYDSRPAAGALSASPPRPPLTMPQHNAFSVGPPPQSSVSPRPSPHTIVGPHLTFPVVDTSLDPPYSLDVTANDIDQLELRLATTSIGIRKMYDALYKVDQSCPSGVLSLPPLPNSLATSSDDVLTELDPPPQTKTKTEEAQMFVRSMTILCENITKNHMDCFASMSTIRLARGRQRPGTAASRPGSNLAASRQESSVSVGEGGEGGEDTSTVVRLTPSTDPLRSPEFFAALAAMRDFVTLVDTTPSDTASPHMASSAATDLRNRIDAVVSMVDTKIMGRPLTSGSAIPGDDDGFGSGWSSEAEADRNGGKRPVKAQHSPSGSVAVAVHVPRAPNRPHCLNAQALASRGQAAPPPALDDTRQYVDDSPALHPTDTPRYASDLSSSTTRSRSVSPSTSASSRYEEREENRLVRPQSGVSQAESIPEEVITPANTPNAPTRTIVTPRTSIRRLKKHRGRS